MSHLIRTETFQAYVLLLEIPENIEIPIGSLGIRSFPSGQYAYAGSAKQHAMARIRRHARLAALKPAPKHWHIDNLLTHPSISLIRVYCYKNVSECQLAEELHKTGNAIQGFGSSDCKAGCTGHLFKLRGSKLPLWRESPHCIFTPDQLYP